MTWPEKSPPRRFRFIEKPRVDVMTKPALKVGDRVRVLRVPPSVEEQGPEETRQIFRRCVGQILQIDGFDDYGHLELNVRGDGSQCSDYCSHTIWIEPEFVEYVS